MYRKAHPGLPTPKTSSHYVALAVPTPLRRWSAGIKGTHRYSPLKSLFLNIPLVEF